MRFSSFLDNKNNQAKKELKIIKNLLSDEDLKIEEFLDNESPYLFLKTDQNDLGFEGIRIYKIGSNLAYRIQNESQTEPYGKAYPLEIEKAFEELIANMSEEEAAKKIKNLILEEFKSFFKQSVKAQEKINAGLFDPQNKIMVNGSAGDLSNTAP